MTKGGVSEKVSQHDQQCLFMFVCDIARRQTFFSAVTFPHSLLPLRRLKLDWGNGYNTISFFPLHCSTPFSLSPLFHLSFDLGLGDILHYLQCVKITFKRKWNTSTTPLRLNSPWFHHMHPHVCYSEKFFFGGMADGTLPHSHSHSNIWPLHLDLYPPPFHHLNFRKARGEKCESGLSCGSFSPLFGLERGHISSEMASAFPPPARNNISMWNDCGILHS